MSSITTKMSGKEWNWERTTLNSERNFGLPNRKDEKGFFPPVNLNRD